MFLAINSVGVSFSELGGATNNSSFIVVFFMPVVGKFHLSCVFKGQCSGILSVKKRLFVADHEKSVYFNLDQLYLLFRLKVDLSFFFPA